MPTSPPPELSQIPLLRHDTAIMALVDRQFSAATFLGHSVAATSAIVAVLMLALWARSFHGSSAALTLESFSGTELQMASWKGRVMFGVFEPETRQRRFWRPRAPSLSDMVLDDDQYVIAASNGWGIAVPHLLIAFLAMVPVAWWVLVFRDRNETRRRLRLGLCMECGYDVRHANGRCPECGAEYGYGARTSTAI